MPGAAVQTDAAARAGGTRRSRYRGAVAHSIRVDAVDRGDLLAAARETRLWQRGDLAEAVRETLEASAGSLFGRFTAWVWTGTTAFAEPAWLIPVRASDAAAFAPPRPAEILARLIAAAVEAEADPERLRIEAWEGFCCLIVPGAIDEIAGLAVADALDGLVSRVDVQALPAAVTPHPTPVALPPFPLGDGTGLVGLARRTGLHPARVALALAHHGVPVVDPSPGMVGPLREWGVARRPFRVPPPPPSLEVDDDPCPRRRHARRVLRRLFRMGKIGSQYHTEFEHLYRGAPPELRRDALEVGEALLRSGLLGEKPSVGQRHVYLRREALPEIHALMDRGETHSAALAQLWTAPGPGAVLTERRAPSP